MWITALVATLLAAPAAPGAPLLTAPLDTAPLQTASASSDVFESAEFGFRIAPPIGSTVEELAPLADEEYLLRWITERPSFRLETLVRAAIASADASPLDSRRRAAERVRQQPNVAAVTPGTLALAEGRSVPSLRVTFGTDEDAERIEAFFFQANGLRFIVQFRAAERAFDLSRETVESTLASFATIPIDPALVRDRQLRALAQRCASELDWAQTWEEAALRSRKERKLILAVARFYPGFDFPDVLATGPLFDADVQQLIAHRFIPLRVGPDRAVPFRNPELYGLSETTLGHGLLIATSDGRVIHESSVVATSLVDAYLRRVLDSAAHHDAPPPDATLLEQARWYYARGQLDRSLDALGDARNSSARLLRAQCFRRMRDPRAAIEIEAVVAARPDDLASRMEQARILQGLGRLAEATEQLEAIAHAEEVEQDENGASVEAAVRLAELYEAMGERAAADALLERVVAEHPDHRWARRAAANLTRSTRDLELALDPTWPTQEQAAASAIPPRTGITPNASAALAAGQYLIDRQLPNGEWPTPHRVGLDPNAPDALSEAIAAIAGHALLPYRDEPSATRAIDRVLDRILERVSTPREELVHYMDYWVWTRIYELRFVAACLDAEVGERAKVERAARRLVDAVVERQRPSGGWSYYATRDLGSEAPTDTGSFSFVTAAAVLSLRAAERSGLEVPAAVFERAGIALDRARSDQGGWSYHCGVHAHAVPTSRRASAGRGPLIQHARHELGRASLDELRDALATFVEFTGDLRAEQGKVLMHAGPEGQGSHYILFDCATAADAITRLPEAERAAFARPLLALVAHCHTADGGYHDMPGMGRATGTALALECFGALGLAVPAEAESDGR